MSILFKRFPLFECKLYVVKWIWSLNFVCWVGLQLHIWKIVDANILSILYKSCNFLVSQRRSRSIIEYLLTMVWTLRRWFVNSPQVVWKVFTSDQFLKLFVFKPRFDYLLGDIIFYLSSLIFDVLTEVLPCFFCCVINRIIIWIRLL